MKGRRITLMATLAMVLAAASANAAMLMTDNFNSYTLGNLVPQDAWTAHSGAGTGPVQVLPNSPCYFPPEEPGNFIQLVPGQAEDVNKPIGSEMGAGDKWYAGFCVHIDGLSPVTKSDYFAHFLQGTTLFAAKIGVTLPAAGGDYRFYLWQGSGSGPGTALWATDFQYSTCHRIVTAYDYDTGDVEMWVDPVLALGEDGNPSVEVLGIYPGNEIIAYAFRQGSNNPATEDVDNLQVGTTWGDVAGPCVPEPGTLALLLIGGVLAARRRR